MNRKILMSLGVLVFVAAVSMTATGAFFSDSETSTGNTFTAGAIDLKVDSQQHYNRMVCTLVDQEEVLYLWQPEEGFVPGPNHYPLPGTPCNGTWELTDLQNGVHKFWNFTDVKPGDEGENTISLHIDSNPAWACIDVSLTKNDDMDCNDPENQVEGDNCPLSENAPDGDLFDGDLAQNLKFAAWADDGDNIWEQGEPLLFSNQSGPASDVLGGKTYTLADSLTGTPLPGGSTSYIGLAWCAGTQTVNLDLNTITCDGAGMGNEAQTDSMTADVTFRVEQYRNNPNFLCQPRGEEPGPTTGTITVDKIVTFTQDTVVGVDVNDFTLNLSGPSGDIVVTDNIASGPLLPGTYTVTEVYSNVPEGIQFNGSFSGACTEVGDTGEGTVELVAGQNLVCTLTNLVTTPVI